MEKFKWDILGDFQTMWPSENTFGFAFEFPMNEIFQHFDEMIEWNSQQKPSSSSNFRNDFQKAH